ncbi:MAG TPA: acyltransferase [Dactylosporangium sp.]|nr:acyltransferase [Dactylosporangium sp.]
MTTERDRAIDALRAIAILGVVLGHWLVTAVVRDGDTIRVASPLRAVPWLAPASWLFQTLAVFFFVGGMVAARSTIDRYSTWLRSRLTRLFRPVLALLIAWTVLLAVLYAWHSVTTSPADPTGTSGDLLSMFGSHTVLKLVASPLWFLLVFAALTAATPLVRRLHPAWPLAVVALVDTARFALDAPAWIGWTNLAAGWLVPFCLGAAWTRGELRSRTTAWLLLLGGATATVALTRWFGYPVSMVGVPGQGISNLNPPTLAAVTFGIAQCGAALLLMPALRRAMQRPRLWLVVAVVNLSAMTIFLWHQTSLIAVTVLSPAPLPGLHTTPQSTSWLTARVMWLPVFAAVLLAFWLLFLRVERPGVSPSMLSGRSTPVSRPPHPVPSAPTTAASTSTSASSAAAPLATTSTSAPSAAAPFAPTSTSASSAAAPVATTPTREASPS